jgi:hypothetical protein
MFKKLFIISVVYILLELFILSSIIIENSWLHTGRIIQFIGEIIFAFVAAGCLIGFIALIVHLNNYSKNPYLKKTSFCIITGLLMPFVFLFYLLSQLH